MVRNNPLSQLSFFSAAHAVPASNALSPLDVVPAIDCIAEQDIEIHQVRFACNPADQTGKLQFWQAVLQIQWQTAAGAFLSAMEIMLDLPAISGPVTMPVVSGPNNMGINYQLPAAHKPLILRAGDIGGGPIVQIGCFSSVVNTDGAAPHSYNTFLEVDFRRVAGGKW